ncbi:MAG: FMN-binding protein [Candidatus Izemoplasmatales bacterium]
MNKGLVSGLVLLSLGLLCGILLSVVNYFTAPKIKEVEDAIKYEALSGFYTLADYDISEVEGTGDFGTIFILNAKGTEDIQAIVYTVRAQGYSDSQKVEMLIAVNSDLSVENYQVVSHSETTGFGADIVDNDFNVLEINDLSGFDAVAGVTKTSNAIKACFTLVSERIAADLGGGLSE